MKKTLFALVALTSVSLSTAVFADGSGGGATGIGIGNAGASAVVNGGDSYGLGGSVGAAECANALNILGIGGSMSDRGCELVKSAIAGYQAGLTTKSEARAIYFAGVKDMGVTLRYPNSDAPSAMLATAPKKPAANVDKAPTLEPVRFTFDGKRYVLRDAENITRYNSCQSIALAGYDRPVIKPGCN